MTAIIRKPGPSAFRPSDDQRAHVKTLSSYGLPLEVIASLVVNKLTDRPITVKTLRKHFDLELSSGAVEAAENVARTFYEQAVGVPAKRNAAGKITQRAKPPVLAATIYWMKLQARQAEADRARREAEDARAAAIIDEADRDV